jgi:hypothetical protein
MMLVTSSGTVFFVKTRNADAFVPITGFAFAYEYDALQAAKIYFGNLYWRNIDCWGSWEVSNWTNPSGLLWDKRIISDLNTSGMYYTVSGWEAPVGTGGSYADACRCTIAHIYRYEPDITMMSIETESGTIYVPARNKTPYEVIED